ncbi:MAG: hypothetical protein ABSG31_00185 [Tepidisphaeraceae bacterium]|jgi:hypothetical protein
MQWFADRSVSEEIAQALADRQDLVHRSPDDSLTPPDVLDFAYAKQWDVITADPAVARAAVAGKSRFNRSIVLLKSAEDVERLFERYKRLTPGRLYTVTASRVKVRQLSRFVRRAKSDKTPAENSPQTSPEENEI